MMGGDPFDPRLFQIPAICGLPYTGPDPLDVGVGLCVVDANLLHAEHRDRYGRTWAVKETDPGTVVREQHLPTHVVLEPIRNKGRRTVWRRKQ